MTRPPSSSVRRSTGGEPVRGGPRRTGRPFQVSPERLRRSRPVRVLRLPVVAELGDGSVVAVRDEDRVEPEAAGASRLVPDPAFEDARAPLLVSLRRQRDQLADVARPPAATLHALELGQQPVDVELSGEARRPDPRRAAEALDLEAGVLAEHPGTRPVQRPPEHGLRARVLVVGLADLRRILVDRERLDLPAGKRPPQLAELPRIRRGQESLYGFQRAPRTSSARLRASISSAAVWPVASRTRRSTRRLSPSSANSRALTVAPAPSTASRTDTALAPGGRSTASRPSSGRVRAASRYARIRSGHRLRSTSAVVTNAAS